MNRNLRKETADQEKAKYETVWGHDIYRKVSPGELEMERAYRVMKLGLSTRPTLNDYGSGPARATQWFRSKGVDAIGIDIAGNASETDAPIEIACLWDMPNVRVAQHGFCCDVLEHIPRRYVDDVIREIYSKTAESAYFRIAIRPDQMGPKLIGEPLHLTVEGREWWARRLNIAFDFVQVVEETNRDVVMHCWG